MTHRPFSDRTALATYAQNARLAVPGFDSMHLMASVILAGQAPQGGRILVLGAGGGMELGLLAEARSDWSLDGVDPSEPMLDLARETLGDHAGRVTFHLGYIDDAPTGPFDGAVCILTLHFLPAAERLRTLQEVHRRLAPGAPFVVAHCSFPQEPVEVRSRWRDLEEAYIVASGGTPEMARKRREGVEEALPVLSPEEDEALLRQAGFGSVTPFYLGFTFRGWVACA
ncbi:class I SAM-dependent methyltransferase [Roseibacterium beibuensis]|uniref:class I SAM-dependent methyltransferase n=1 Tax=[Roseibacterium] beibuensis TaxID=1193142 RepID=UPI00217D27D8|nr:class I SAM-dependent methyltransferase [Roseibacterium beibuensis]MCS6625516.1 class I SAM-dependent methyltransferase [Roseibacterium beibuensis]